VNFNKFFQKIYRTLLDLFLPKNYEQRFLDNLTAEEFLDLTEPAVISNASDIISAVKYKNKLVKQAVWSLKFKNNQKIARLFAIILYDILAEELAELKLLNNFERPLLIPIPLARQKLRERGYNQTELIARAMQNLDKNNLFEYREDILKKIKNTAPQSRARNATERARNLKGCFQVVAPLAVKKRNILLLDDVITTGATLREATRVLRRAGARRVLLVTVAR